MSEMPVHAIATDPPSHALRVVVDAGHGAQGNTGNTSVACESEAAFTQRTQDATLGWLHVFPGLELRSGRPPGELVAYDDRIAAFNAWPADAVISVHSDSRAAANFAPDPASGCWGASGEIGFSVLYSDDGAPALVAARRRLADAMAGAMIEAGFSAYPGADYPGLYDRVGEGVFVDRHAPGKRIKMLHATAVPLVIVETHQALDRSDVALWNEPQTQAAFASAVYRAVVRAGE